MCCIPCVGTQGNWYLLGVPFLIKTRRVLDGMDTGEFHVTPSTLGPYGAQGVPLMLSMI